MSTSPRKGTPDGTDEMIEVLYAADVTDTQTGLDALVAAGYWADDEDDMRRAIRRYLAETAPKPVNRRALDALRDERVALTLADGTRHVGVILYIGDNGGEGPDRIVLDTERRALGGIIDVDPEQVVDAALVSTPANLIAEHTGRVTP